MHTVRVGDALRFRGWRRPFAAVLAAPEMYDVSLTAAAWRLVETSREMCALVVSINGHVAWSVRSPSWRLPLPEVRRPIPVDTMAAAALQGELPLSTPEPIEPGTWLSLLMDDRWHRRS
ncbi:MAG: hypothetical protein H7Z40_20990 [Phycisphaerae bacterium]|nr:hypothetical protein [Gemmatimonadaceae bacterium]